MVAMWVVGWHPPYACFDHPVTGERLEFTSALPGDMVGLIGGLRAG